MGRPGYDLDTQPYAKSIAGSKKIRWDIDADVLRGREFDFSKKFLPDGISKVDRLSFLSEPQQRFLSQIEGRTYASMFGFVERFIVAKMLDISRDHWLGDQVALEALVRFCDEELKHQELFRRLEKMMARGMPDGYEFPWDPNQVAAVVLEKSTWAVMALIYEIELFTQEHYKQSIAQDENLSDLYKDVFLYHWKEEAHHAFLDSLEWSRVNKKITREERDEAIGEVIDLVTAVDGILQKQCEYDIRYFIQNTRQSFFEDQIARMQAVLLEAYRWQYIFSGVEHPKYQELFGQMTTEEQRERIGRALAPLAPHA
ncbi:MAG: hypothetical protein RBT11_15320 [Desulfobacterales bacterium]|jgi:hypothetical protein|nr:hypothetical protein [Desulfobacterales bacterium]